MGVGGPHIRRYVVALVVAGSALAPLGRQAPPSAATEAVAPAATGCERTAIRVHAPTSRLRPDGCSLSGRRIAHGPLTARVPAPGRGVVLTALSHRGEWSLDVRTRRDGVVVVRTGSPRPRTVASAVVPGNDTVAGAVALPLPWSIAGSTVEATADGDDAAASAACDTISYVAPDAPSVWYSLTPPTDTVLFTTLQPTATYPDSWYDVQAASALYTRDPTTGALTPVSCSLSEETPHLLGGHTYLLQVQSTGGTIDFVSSGRPPTAGELPANDAFAAAQPMPLGKNVTVDRYDRATLEPGEPSPPCGPAPVGSVWFKVDPGAWRRLALTDSLFNETATLWTGNALGALTPLGCLAPPVPTSGPITVTPPSARWALPRGGSYYLQLAQVYPGARSSQAFQIDSDDSCSGECLPPCRVRDHRIDGRILPRDPWRWRFNVARGLKGLTSAQVLRSIKTGAKVVTSSRNDCGLPDKVSAKATYLGKTKATASMCRNHRGDGRNVVAVSARESGSTLAVTCYRLRQPSPGAKWRITESDMEIYAGWRWTTDADDPGCRQEQDLPGVMAHEVGHVFGLDHAEKARAGNLTMYPIAPPACNASARTLGLGDVLALRSLY